MADEVLVLPDLDLRPNEASGLARIDDPGLLASHSWDRGFWVVLDEGEITDCVAAIGHRSGAAVTQGWDILRLSASRTGDAGETGDAEAVAARDGWVYLFGSQHGGKSGPIRPSESWVARFREAEVNLGVEGSAVALDVRRLDLALHRLVNDALREHGVAVAPLGDESRAAFIDQTLDEGRREGAAWVANVHEDDNTINVEGATFLADGSLLLGLRWPTSADGRPLLVAVSGLELLFAPDRRLPVVDGFWVVDAVGREGDMAGVRDLTTVGDEIHLVTGNIDSKAKFSVLLTDHPGGRHTVSTHFSCTLPAGATGGEVTAEAVREFPDLPRVEGIAADSDGAFFYVSDEDEGVSVRCTPLRAG